VTRLASRVTWIEYQTLHSRATVSFQPSGIGVQSPRRGIYVFPAFLIQIVIVLIVVGLILWAVTQIPMDPAISRIIRVVVIVFVVIWLLYALMDSGSFIGGSGPYLRR
jgi:hypothetical protein